MTRKSQALLFLLILAIMMFILYFTMVVSGKSQGSDTQGQESQTALVPRPMAPKQVAANPYMADSDNAIHNDVYATDVTDAVAPLGICSQLTTSVETQNIQAPSAAFYDTKGNAVTPYLGGVAIVTMDGETVEHLGSFVPSRDDGGRVLLPDLLLLCGQQGQRGGANLRRTHPGSADHGRGGEHPACL